MIKKLFLCVCVCLCLFFASIQVIVAQEAEEEDAKTTAPYFFIEGEDTETESLPLKETSAQVNIAGVIADVRIKQVYVNTGKKPIEAIYVFPASTKAAIYAMEMQIGKRAIIAKIQEAAQAKVDYEQAKNEGKTASLLEQKRPNVFQMNVANILPKDTIIVYLSYTELLVPEEGVYEFVYPTVVGPRYAGKSEKESEKWVSNPFMQEGEKPSYRFDLQTTVNAGLPIQQITCTTHKVKINYQSKSSANIVLESSEKEGGNRDFILKYRLAGDQIESGLLLNEGKDENFFLLMAQPPKRIEEAQIPQREYVFIVDISGSMNGFPLDISKKLLKNLIGSLKPTDRFNVLLFAGSSDVLSEQSIEANEANINAALRVIDNYSGGGSTELLPALKTAFALKGTENYSRSFVVITDGYVTVETTAFDLIRKNLNQANVFAFGIGTGVNRYLIEGMAHAGMGEPFIVTNYSEAQTKAEKFRKYIQSPVLTKVKVSYKNFEVYDIEPIAIPDVLAERPILVYGKFRGKPQGEIILTGSTGKGSYEAKIPVASAKTQNNQAIKYLWARYKIKLLDDYNKLEEGEYGYQEADKERIKEITQLGLKYNLLTAYTSFVAIDSEVRNKEGKPTSIKQPLPLPEGVSNKALGNTASILNNSHSGLSYYVEESYRKNGSRFSHMNKTGSVKRGLGAIRTSIPSEKVKIYGDTLLLNWGLKENTLHKNIAQYEIQISNLNDNIFYSQRVKDSSMIIPLTTSQLASESILIVKVAPIGTDGKYLENLSSLDGDAISKLELTEKQAIASNIAKIQQSFTKETASKRFVTLANYFEDRELYADAMLAYYHAIRLAPKQEMQKFKQLYDDFLERNGLK